MVHCVEMEISVALCRSERTFYFI